ncbi:MAG: lysophospholipid acyltransferase family protein [Acidobacteriota bacterium]
MRKLFLFILKELIFFIIIFISKTSKIKFVRRENFENLKRSGEKVILLLWHGRIILPIYVHRKQSIMPLVSLSKDGDLAAVVLKRFGYIPIRGSSSRGGIEAFKAMKDKVFQNIIAIIPDGPRGPGRKLKPGALYLAKQTGSSIIPLTFSCKIKKILKGWDKHLIFSPFNKCAIFYGERFKVPDNLNDSQIEELRKELEEKMVLLDREADEYFK